MKKRIIVLSLFFVMSMGISFAQKTSLSGIEKYQFEQPEHLLDGYSFNYQYVSGMATHMEFYDGKVKYEWITGPRKENGNKRKQYIEHMKARIKPTL